MSIFEGVVEAVSVKPSKYDEGNFSHGYKIGDGWYNIESTSESKMASRGDKVKAEVEGKELIRMKVIGKGEVPPSLGKDGKPAYKAKGGFAGKAPYKKPIQEQVAISLLSIMNRATDLAIAQNDPSIANVYAIAGDMSHKIVSLYGEEAIGIVEKVFSSGATVAKTATNGASKATSTEKRVAAQKKMEAPADNEDVFDDDIPF